MMPDSDMLGINLMHCYESIIKIYTDMGEAELAAPFIEKYEACLRENERVVNS